MDSFGRAAAQYTAGQMRLLSFVQVLLLLLLGTYLLLVTLENPMPVRLPLPLGRGDWSVPVGVAVTAFLLLGALYAALLLLPSVWWHSRRRRREGQLRQQTEEKLAATLQARLGSLPAYPLPPRPGAAPETGDA